MPGRNELVAEVANQGGPAGFVFKLALKDRDGSIRYVVSDASWTAAARRDSNDRSPVRVIAPLGQGPWGDAFNRASTHASRGAGSSRSCRASGSSGSLRCRAIELGSWVSLTFDGQGRLIVSDEGDTWPLSRDARRRSTARARRRSSA